jgi:APA family basic amino acid/polyamine antiporter
VSTTNTEEGLKRVIGVTGLASNIINGILGAGIYVLPAIVSAQMGAAGILSYLFCGVMLVTIMLCYAEIGSRIETSGGSYIYVETAFGPFAGFIINWLYFFGWGVLGSAALMNVVADSLAVFFPVFSNPIARAALYLVLLGGLTWINIRGVKESVRFLQVVTTIKLLPLFAIIVFGLSSVKMSNLHWEHSPSINTLGSTALVLFYAFAGFETALGCSGEIKNPRHTIPFGILLGGLIVFLFYLLIQTVTQGILGAQINDFKNAPLAEVARTIVGPIGATIILIAAIISTMGNVGNDVMATPRLFFAGAKEGIFPKFLGRVHPRFATPYVAVIVYAGLIFIFSTTGGFKQLAILASGALLLVYLSVVLATIKLKLKKIRAANKGFVVPGGLIIPIIAVVAITWLLAHLSKQEMISTVIFIAFVAIIYLVMNVMRKKGKVESLDSPLPGVESSLEP